LINTLHLLANTAGEEHVCAKCILNEDEQCIAWDAFEKLRLGIRTREVPLTREQKLGLWRKAITYRNAALEPSYSVPWPLFIGITGVFAVACFAVGCVVGANR
jgi:hypothetical protein